jgi:SpoVK/Ycf46/Vps4 family AAA+-type ATPase
VSAAGDDDLFPLLSYLSSVKINADIIRDSGSQKIFGWDAQHKELHADNITGEFKFSYGKTEFFVYKATWSTGHDIYYFYDLVFDGLDDGAGQKLAADVYEWVNSLKEEIWVFQGEGWEKSNELYKAIQAASWDDLVLDESFKAGLNRDTDTFFASQEIYDSLGITWKRGILLLGPPGNGKTESIKALLRQTKHSVLYVKTIATYGGSVYGVRSVFEHAREHAPCILVFEDLDSLIGGQVKSFFLNEMDGLAQNNGILTIATTNHPKDIDDAIINRPSRFDTKYTFDLPTPELRKEFVVKWLRKIVMLSSVVFEKSEDELAEGIAQKTDGWSFAFLKELCVSFLLRMAHDKSSGANNGETPEPADTILFKQLEILSSQIIQFSAEQEEMRKMKKSADVEGFYC